MNFLNLQNWKILEVIEEKDHYYVRAAYENANPHCPSCPSGIKQEISPYGYRKRCLKDAPVHGKAVSIFLSVCNYKCRNCDGVFSDQVPELEPRARLTKRLVTYIEINCLRKSFSAVSSETGISNSEVGNIFHKFLKKLTDSYKPEAPQILGMDDVYIGRVARFVLTDIGKKNALTSYLKETLQPFMLISAE